MATTPATRSPYPGKVKASATAIVRPCWSAAHGRTSAPMRNSALAETISRHGRSGYVRCSRGPASIDTHPPIPTTPNATADSVADPPKP